MMEPSGGALSSQDPVRRNGRDSQLQAEREGFFANMAADDICLFAPKRMSLI